MPDHNVPGQSRRDCTPQPRVAPSLSRGAPWVLERKNRTRTPTGFHTHCATPLGLKIKCVIRLPRVAPSRLPSLRLTPGYGVQRLRRNTRPNTIRKVLHTKAHAPTAPQSRRDCTTKARVVRRGGLPWVLGPTSRAIPKGLYTTAQGRSRQRPTLGQLITRPQSRRDCTPQPRVAALRRPPWVHGPTPPFIYPERVAQYAPELTGAGA